MRYIKPFLLTILIVMASSFFAKPASADGIIIPNPPMPEPWPYPEPFPVAQLAIVYHRVHVTIEDQVAITHVDQVFRNDQDWPIEGTYVFPLPPEASVTNFTLWQNGEPVEAQILDKDEARKTYEEIVRQLRDPALLEYVDRGAVQASIFPISPGEERRIELEYSQILEADTGLIHYSYPLNTEKFSTLPIEDVSITIEVHSKDPIRAIYSPSHKIAIEREGDNRFHVGYEEYDVTPNKDFDLYYSLADQAIGVNLITYRDPQASDDSGFFLLLAAPGVEVDPESRIAKDVIMVLDQSGSMEGEKFVQAQQALRYVLDHLNPEDRFNIISFSTGTRSYADELRPANKAAEARRWVDSLSAKGSTDINRALLEALDQIEYGRPAIVIFLTDGLPTEGVIDTDAILENVAQSAPDNTRLFVFGVGYDVDTFLLDLLAKEHHGTTTYVTPEQAIDEIVSGFYAKVNTPVLTDLVLDTGEVTIFDLHPAPLPDLFAGSQLVLVGRYRHPGSTTVKLEGMLQDQLKSFEYPNQVFRSSGGPDFLPRLWATRKIGALLNQIRLEGPNQEVIDQIVQLSIRYGIITPYTSYLVTEPKALGAEVQDSIAAEAYAEALSADHEVTGKNAVERAATASGIGAAEVPLAPSGAAADIVRIAGTRTFRLIDGIWMDTGFDPDSMTPIKVPFLSDDYFALTAAYPDLAAAFSLGPEVIAIGGEIVYQVVGSDQIGDPVTLPPADPEQSNSSELNNPTMVANAETSEEAGSNSICPGAALLVGLVAFPLGARTRRN